MEDLKNLDELYRDQQVIRDRLLRLYKANPVSTRQMSENMGLHFNTVNRFLKEGKNIGYVQLMKIINYVEKKENECKTLEKT